MPNGVISLENPEVLRLYTFTARFPNNVLVLMSTGISLCSIYELDTKYSKVSTSFPVSAAVQLPTSLFLGVFPEMHETSEGIVRI